MDDTKTLDNLDVTAAAEEAEAVEFAEEEIIKISEAVLFAAGHPIEYKQLGALFGITDDEMRKILIRYADTYNNEADGMPRGVMLALYDTSCQLCTKPEYISYIRQALGIKKNGNLSPSSIEVLSIVAYNQPVTRAYIDAVRGVDSSYAVSSLLDRGLIACRGRLDAPGRPMLYGTTEDFLRCFGLSSLAELPGITSSEAIELMARIGKKYMPVAEPDHTQLDIDSITEEESAETPSNAEAAPEVEAEVVETIGSGTKSEAESN